MGGFRVTKYDPRLRLPSGTYTVSEWTSLSDIGNVYGGRVFEYSDYLNVENLYVEAVKIFMQVACVEELQIKDLEKYEFRGQHISGRELSEMETFFNDKCVVDANVSGKDLDIVVRFVLREMLWCRLEGPDGFYVHFGYDYYMYVGAKNIGATAPAMPDGIFAERFSSPYFKT